MAHDHQCCPGVGLEVTQEVHHRIASVGVELAGRFVGEDGALNFLVGQVMQETGGSADPGTVNELLRAELDG